MKTIFDNTAREELMSRINSLTKKNTAQWGKMNAYQMSRHCTVWNNWILGTNKYNYRQEWLGWIFGKMALKGLVKDDRPMKKNMPSGKDFMIKEEDGDIELEKRVWMEQVAAYERFSNPGFIHDFFGKMTVDEIGILAYKHMDHHLRQFSL
jgi:hypothetical protein